MHHGLGRGARWPDACRLVPLVLALWAAPGAAAEPMPAIGRVVSVRGVVEVRSDGEWQPLRAGSPLHVGDRVRTGEDGSARIAFHDGSELDLARLTELLIARYPEPGAKGREAAEVRLVRGRVEGRTERRGEAAGSDFRVTSPTANVNAMGAQFVLDYDPASDATRVTGLRGRLAVHGVLDPTGRGVIVTARQTTSVRRGRRPDPPREAELSLLERMAPEAFEAVWPDEVTWRASGILRGVESGGGRWTVGAPGGGAPEVRERRGGSVSQGNDVGEILGESPAALGAPGGVDLGIRF